MLRSSAGARAERRRPPAGREGRHAHRPPFEGRVRGRRVVAGVRERLATHSAALRPVCWPFDSKSHPQSNPPRLFERQRVGAPICNQNHDITNHDSKSTAYGIHRPWHDPRHTRTAHASELFSQRRREGGQGGTCTRGARRRGYSGYLCLRFVYVVGCITKSHTRE